MARKYFGTDGIRGRVGEQPITPEFVLKLGWAAGRVLVSEGCNKVLIGKDTRQSGYMFESALEAGAAALEQQLAQLPTAAAEPAAEPVLVVPPMVAALRPVSRHPRVGEQSAVVCILL